MEQRTIMGRRTVAHADAGVTDDPAICVPIDASKRLPCDVCGTPMEPEHAHYRCPACHYVLPCCGW